MTLEGAGPPGPPARLRALRPAARDGPREPARAAHVLGRRRRGRQGAAAARVRPRLGRRARPRRARPVLRRPGRLRERCSTRSRPPAAACSPRCGEPRRRGPGSHRPRGAARRAGRRRRHQRGLPRAVRRRVVRVRQDARGRRAAASTRPRRPACAGWRSPAGCASRRCSASATTVLVLDWVDEAAAATAPRSARAWRRCTRRARTSSARAARSRRAASAAGGGAARRRGRRRARRRVARGSGAAAPRVALAPNDSGAGLADVLRRAAAAAAAARTPASPASATGRRERVRSHARARRVRPSHPPRLHGDLWSGNMLWGARRARLADRPRGLWRAREVDLAMLRLFGSPGKAFLAAYEERFRSRPATSSASSSTSCSRCSSTRRCSAAATPRAPSAWRASTPDSRQVEDDVAERDRRWRRATSVRLQSVRTKRLAAPSRSRWCGS